MTKLASQQAYWNSRAAEWGNYAPPLIPGDQDLAFMRQQLVPGGSALVLGATPELCSMALEVSDSVTAVDFAEDVIAALRLDGVQYTCADWFEFLKHNPEQFDNIMTDGGLVCLEFPDSWQEMAGLIGARLKPGGVFAARVYLSTSEPPKDSYENPMLGRFVTSIGNVDSNWMVHPKHGDYAQYDVRYAFPPESEVRRVFGALVLHTQLVPDYEEGQRFVSFAWQCPLA